MLFRSHCERPCRQECTHHCQCDTYTGEFCGSDGQCQRAEMQHTSRYDWGAFEDGLYAEIQIVAGTNPIQVATNFEFLGPTLFWTIAADVDACKRDCSNTVSCKGLAFYALGGFEVASGQVQSCKLTSVRMGAAGTYHDETNNGMVLTTIRMPFTADMESFWGRRDIVDEIGRAHV